jgi:transposase
METTIFYGIDIAKATFVSATQPEGVNKPKTQLWAYLTDADIAAFVATLPQNAYCIVEATGNYHSRLVYALVEAQITVAVVNPKSVKHFAKMRNMITKTDNADAQLLLKFANQQPDLYRPFTLPNETVLSLQQYRTTLSLLETQKQQFNNQLEALRYHARPNADLLALVEQQILQHTATISDIHTQMQEMVNLAHHDNHALLLTIPSIGPVVAPLFVNTFASFLPIEGKSTGKTFAKFLGVAPIIEQSGTSVRKKPYIGRSGAPTLRAKMYLATVSLCTRSKPDNIFRLFYEKLVKNGKNKKQAIIAVMHKVIRIAVAVIETKTAFSLERYGKIA